ncbi:MAG TPA: hypothetical protein VKT82_12670 [Ktedonobacterales bacterium]|nr:hypothetical protein [Ktedonobacterales bacterium]
MLRQAYAVAGLAPPQRVSWLVGPLQLVKVLVPSSRGNQVLERVGPGMLTRVYDRVRADLGINVRISVDASVKGRVRDRVKASVWARVRDRVKASVWDQVWKRVGATVEASVRLNVWERLDGCIQISVGAYEAAPLLAVHQFYEVYFASTQVVQSLAHFNQLVSGYWLGEEEALLVRRPKVLSLDAAGQLHSATGTCLEYHDGWGFYAWHGVVVPERVILRPETLTREDVLTQENVEVRRIIQERMGSERFVAEVGGVVLDSSPGGTLYEVTLPEEDPEKVARYVQVQDASTAQQYFVRVPPTVQTAAEAVAWTFQVGVEDYHPAQET